MLFSWLRASSFLFFSPPLAKDTLPGFSRALDTGISVLYNDAMSEEHQHPATITTHAERDDVVKIIASELGEHEEEPLRLLRRIVKRLGTEQALAFLKETVDIEEAGGMWLIDGSRRRTKGGVFFYLVRTKGPKEVRALFFKSKARPTGQQTATAAAPIPSMPAPFTWADRVAALDAIGTEKGGASTVKITVIGRPGKVIDRGTCVVTSMRAKQAPSLPKGLPIPPSVPTNYLVYIAVKQWRKVAEAIADPEDVLIVEGFPQLDPETSSIAVFATNTTTKKLQMAQRQGPQGAPKGEMA
jgi:hypothetical protein